MSPTPLPTPASRWQDFAQRRPWAVEWLYFGIALGVYQLSRALAIGGREMALGNAWDIVHLEQALGLYFERDLQALFLGDGAFIQAINQIYIRAHLPLTTLFFVWLYRSHREGYAWVRNGFFVANAVAVLVYVVYPVAPPRLMETLGIVDTLHRESGVDLYRGWRSHFFNQYAAVPSMHCGYAMIVSLGVARYARALWVKAAGLLYAPLIVFVVMVTGNHFVLDAVAGWLVVAAGYGGLALYERWAAARERLLEAGLAETRPEPIE